MSKAKESNAVLFQHAYELYLKNEFTAAKEVLNNILIVQRRHVDSILLLGIINAEQQDFKTAIDYFSRGISLNPLNTDLLYNRANARFADGQIAEALSDIERVVLLDPRNVDAMLFRGNLFDASLQHEKAIKAYHQALTINPNYAICHNNLALAYSAKGDFESALNSINQAIRLDGDNYFFIFNRANILKKFERINDAIESYLLSIKIKPNYVDAYFNCGLAYEKKGEFSAAIEMYRSIIINEPEHWDAHLHLGNLLIKIQKYEEGLTVYDGILEKNPKYIPAYISRAGALAQISRVDDAIDCYKNAQVVDPQNPEVYFSFGALLQELGRLDEAVAAYNTAIECKSDFAQCYLNRGLALKDLGDFCEAISSFENAVQIDPSLEYAKLNKALVLLTLGKFNEGWRLYESRWDCEQANYIRQDIKKPLWTGVEDLRAKVILLHSEQGFGDTIQFVRYIEQLETIAGQIILEIQPELCDLLKKAYTKHRIIAKGEPIPEYDYHCPLLSLPLAFHTEIHSIPVKKAYLFSEKSKREDWLKILPNEGKKRVGLVWRGSANHKNDKNRSIVLEELIEWLPNCCQYISLQKEISDSDQQILSHNGILNLRSYIKNFEDTAALCDLMDLVVTVDTSVAHLSGALGKKTWILLPYIPDWRWLTNRNDSPWYPTVDLYRQQKDRQWSPIVKRVAEEIKVFLG